MVTLNLNGGLYGGEPVDAEKRVLGIFLFQRVGHRLGSTHFTSASQGQRRQSLDGPPTIDGECLINVLARFGPIAELGFTQSIVNRTQSRLFRRMITSGRLNRPERQTASLAYL